MLAALALLLAFAGVVQVRWAVVEGSEFSNACAPINLDIDCVLLLAVADLGPAIMRAVTRHTERARLECAPGAGGYLW